MLLETKGGDVKRVKTPRTTELEFSTIELSSSYSTSTANVSFSEPSETPRKEYKELILPKNGKTEVVVESDHVEKIISTLNTSMILKNPHTLGSSHPPEPSDLDGNPLKSVLPKSSDSSKTLRTISTSIATPRPSSSPLTSLSKPNPSTQTPKGTSSHMKSKFRRSELRYNCRGCSQEEEGAFGH